MRIMFVCSTQHLSVEMIYLAKYIAQMPHEFIFSPFVRFEEREVFRKTMSQLDSSLKNIFVDPIFLKSPSMNFQNALNPSTLLKDASSIIRVLRRRKPDAVVCYYLIHAYPFVLLKRILKYSLSVVAQGSDVNLDNTFLQRIVRRLVCKNSNLVFAASWSLGSMIEKEQKLSPIVIPSSTDTSFFRPLNFKSSLRSKWGIDNKRHVILSVSYYHPVKATDLIIKSLRKIKFDNVDLLLAGDGETRKSLEQLTISLGLQGRVRFLGWKGRSELLELFNLADIFALTSISEGLPRALIEAMSCGCIPIVTNVGSTATVVSNGFNGFVINLGNLDEFVERVNEVLSLSEEKRKLMQVRARQTVKDDFDSRRTAKKMVDEIVTFHSSAITSPQTLLKDSS